MRRSLASVKSVDDDRVALRQQTLIQEFRWRLACWQIEVLESIWIRIRPPSLVGLIDQRHSGFHVEVWVVELRSVRVAADRWPTTNPRRDHSLITARVIQLRTLGRIDVLGFDGTPRNAVAAQPKRMALLAFLALASARGFVRRDTLVAMFWPDLDEEHARGALSQALRFLRRELGDDAVSRRGEEEIALNRSRVTWDVDEFDRAHQEGDHRRAIELYAGEFLEGLHVAQAPDVDQWLDSERRRLSLLYAKSLDAISDALSSAGDGAGALVYLRKLVAQDPHNGAVAIKYMRALVATGDRAGAIAHGDKHAERLASDLQAEPDPDVALFAAHLRENPDRRSAPPIATHQDDITSRVTAAPSVENAESPHRAAPMRARAMATAMAISVVAVAVAIAVLLLSRRSSSASASSTRRQITHWGNESNPALSPDGRTLAFVEGERCGTSILNCTDSLVVQDLVGGQTAPLARGTRLNHPKWNPAGGTILFQATRLVDAADTTPGAYLVSWLGGTPQRVGPGAAAAFSSNGDTIVLARATHGDTIRLRFLRSTDMEAFDSVSVPFLSASTVALNGGLSDLDWSRDGKWLALMVYRGEGDRRVLLVSRHNGMVTDSIRVRGRQLVRWVPSGDAVLLLLQGRAAEDIVFRRGVDRRTGRFTSDTATILEIPAGGATFDVSRDWTTMAVVNQSTQTELTAIERLGERVTSRHLHSFTGFSGPLALSPDGRTIAWTRGDAQGENVYLIPFEGGPERAVTSGRHRFHAPVWLRDQRLEVKEGLPSTQLFVFNPQSPQPRPFGPAGYTTGNFYYLQWFGDSLYLLDQTDQHRVFVLDSRGATRDTLSVPDTLKQLVTATPDSRQLWFYDQDSERRRGHKRFYSLDRLTKLVKVAFDARPNSYALGWTDRGFVYATWPTDSASSPTLWRVNGDGTSTQLAVLPTDCDVNVNGLSISRDGTRLVCRRTYATRGIWLWRGLDLGR